MVDTTPSLASANYVIMDLLKRFALELEELLDGDVLSYNGPIIPPTAEMIRDALESTPRRANKLLVVLQTEGGVPEVVVRIVDTLRHHYPECVEFIVPNYAFSAGTVLVLSGNEIHMDYFSVLGPIDPQYQQQDGTWVPALGYIESYKELMKKADEGTINIAEMAILVQFDQGRRQMFEHQCKLAVDLLTDWLPKYKFKNWTETETNKKPVDEEMKKSKATEIAQKLSATEWHSHGRGINKATLENDVGLKIKDFGANPELHIAVRRYSGLLADYMVKVGLPLCAHTANGIVLPSGWR